MLQRSVGEECCTRRSGRELSAKNVAEKCWRRVFERSSGEEFCREVLEVSASTGHCKGLHCKTHACESC